MNKKNEKKMSEAHKRAEYLLTKTENNINAFYNKHSVDILRVFKVFYKQYKEDFDEKLQAYKDGKITKDEYRQYMLSKTIFSDDWRKTVDKMTTAISDMNQKALDTVVSESMAEIYIDNYNTTIRAIGGELLEN